MASGPPTFRRVPAGTSTSTNWLDLSSMLTRVARVRSSSHSGDQPAWSLRTTRPSVAITAN